MKDQMHIAVLIPARNEEALLPRCLQSVIAAKALLPSHVSCELIVLADASTDRTETVARMELGLHGVVLAVAAGCVGRTRALAAEVAIARLRNRDLAYCWLANTDADCQVPVTWLLDQWNLAAQGIDAVAGIVDVDCFAEHQPHVENRFRLSYRINADGSHPHVHGANLGVRAEAYRRAGGWAALDTGEDHDLWQRLRAEGAVCRSVSQLKVLTSGRRVGRAPLGFAGALAAHNDTAEVVPEAAA